jgi:hypothetical protein
VAPRDIPMGSSYHEEIVTAIENSRAVLLLFSERANKSAHVLREVELAEQAEADPSAAHRCVGSRGGLKYMLANKQWVERKGARQLGWSTTIEQLLGGAAPDPKRRGTKRVHGRRRSRRRRRRPVSDADRRRRRRFCCSRRRWSLLGQGCSDRGANDRQPRAAQDGTGKTAGGAPRAGAAQEEKEEQESERPEA